MANNQERGYPMKKSIEERVAGFTIEFVKKVAVINGNLIYDDYYMHCGKKKFIFADIAWDEVTAEYCLSYMYKDHKLDVKEFTEKDDCVAYMVCEGYLYEKMYGYCAYQEDIYGDGDEAERLYKALCRIAAKYNFWFDWYDGALMFYDNAYTTISELRKYEFDDGKAVESPIVVLGPQGGKRITMLRVYAYGGLIGRISTGKGKMHLAEDKGYLKYLSKEYLTQDDDKKYLEDMNEKYIRQEVSEAGYSSADYNTICGKLQKRLEEILDEPCDFYLKPSSYSAEYIDLILKAAKKKFTNENGTIPGERQIETAIVKRHMKKDTDEGWCVVDMEYTVPKELSVSGKEFTPDIIVFDTHEGFGLIELKYDNKSTDNMNKHYNDVQNLIKLIKDEEAVQKIIKELERRSSYLRNYDLIDDTLYQSMKNSHKLWQGFLFVGGEREDTVKLVKSKEALFGKEQNCRFAFYPYDEQQSDDCIDKIELKYSSMKTYKEFTEKINSSEA